MNYGAIPGVQPDGPVGGAWSDGHRDPGWSGTRGVGLGAVLECRHCGHPRKTHRVCLLSGSACTECLCKGFARAVLSWDVVEDGGLWSVQSRDTGKSFDGLPSRRAAEQLAASLTDVEDMLAAIYVADRRVPS